MDVILLAAAVAIGMPLITALIAAASERSKVSEPKARALNRDSVKRAVWITFAVWVVLTLVGWYFTATYDFFPTVGSDKGEEIAAAFRILTIFAVPVFSMVVAILLYAGLRRSTGELPSEDGPAYHGTGIVPQAWLAVTTALTVLVIVYPGLTSIDKVLGVDSNPDVVVDVEGVQWTWLVSYPEEGIDNQRELVLPVDRVVRFNITSQDVLHSFWVPSLLMKIDAVPGLTTVITLTPTETGESSSDPLVRLQCAELCGLGHSSMRINVRVISQAKFDEWVRQKTSQAGR